MILDCASRKLLSYIKTKTKQLVQGIIETDKFYEDYSKFSGINKATASSIVLYLIEKGYLLTSKGDNSKTYLYISHKGLHSKEIAFLDLIPSIIIPIIISLVVTLITLVIKGSWTKLGLSIYRILSEQ